jgi:diaminopropionate ammonia-lyase
LARSLQIENVWIKDESHRFRLNAFKVLGASYALANALSSKLGFENETPSFEKLRSPSVGTKLKDITVITATDGNHGRAVAWFAKQIGCNAIVYMPENTSPARIHSVKAHGATTRIIDGNYDDAVRAASSDAEKNNWLLIQDTSWKGYEQVPAQIMQGYLTLAVEALEQLGGDTPTHVFVQCGVGSFAASMQACFIEQYGHEQCPFFGVVEPATTACFYHSMKENDGHPAAVTGNLDTIMAGLACGEPSILAWEILRNYADTFIACQDSIAIKGMQILGNPLKGDERIISGESGAVTLGLLVHLRTHLINEEITAALRLNSRSRVLLISTEGDTDPEAYRKIVCGEK